MDCRPIGDWPTSAKRSALNFAFSSSTLVLSTDARHVVMSLPIPAANAEQPTIHNPWVLCNRALTVLYGCSEMPRASRSVDGKTSDDCTTSEQLGALT